MGVINSYSCETVSDKERISVFIRGKFQELTTNAAIKKAFRDRRVLLNGEEVSSGAWVKSGDLIELTESGFIPPREHKLDLEILFEDDHMAAIIKPPGITVSGNVFRTIENALNYNLKKSTEPDVLEWPRPVHRLDNPTSGILLIAKTSTAAKYLGQQFKDKKINKTYRALVQGSIQESGEIKTPIEGLEAHTSYKILKVTPSKLNEFMSDVVLTPHTGRTHQLRIHMATLGYPIIGDKLYGIEGKVLKNKGLFLYAVAIDFSHPVTKQSISLKMDLPKKYHAYVEREKLRYEG